MILIGVVVLTTGALIMVGLLIIGECGETLTGETDSGVMASGVQTLTGTHTTTIGLGVVVLVLTTIGTIGFGTIIDLTETLDLEEEQITMLLTEEGIV